MIGLNKGSGVLLIVLTVFYAVGLAGHLVAFLRPTMLSLTPWVLLAAGAAVVGRASWGKPLRSVLLWVVPALGATFALEALGVATGQVFGPYHYTTVLGTLVLGVPPVIGWNWVLVVWGVHATLQRLFPRWHPVGRVLAVGLACVVFDLLLEPVAVGLGYWVWDGGGVPWRNYAAWGLIAAGASWYAGSLPHLPNDSLLGWYVGLQAAFFIALGLWGIPT